MILTESPGDGARHVLVTSGARTRTGDLGIMKPTVTLSQKTRKQVACNDLRQNRGFGDDESAAQCAAFEAWLLSCPVQLTLDQVQTIRGLI